MNGDKHVTIRFSKKTIEDIDNTIEENDGYSNRSEYIRTKVKQGMATDDSLYKLKNNLKTSDAAKDGEKILDILQEIIHRFSKSRDGGNKL